MTKDEALKMAIEYLTNIQLDYKGHEVRKALQEALAQPSQEVKCNPHPDAPHGFMRDESHSQDRYVCECEYWTEPAQEPVSLGDFDNMTKAECVDYIEYLRKEIDLLRFKEWQGLNDDEIDKKTRQMWDISGEIPSYRIVDFARAIEQALKEKNT